jgi:hypothetical protein
MAEGLGSLDLRRWQRIGDPVEFPVWLGLQGLAACSNEPNYVTKDRHNPMFFFGNVKKNGVRYFRTSFPKVGRIGDVVTYRFLDHSYLPDG